MLYLKSAFEDFRFIFAREMKLVLKDPGVLLIFFAACLAYPLLYSYVYSNGLYDDMPVAVVDNADCSASRNFIREVDATREVRIEYKCVNMAEAQQLMQERKVKGIMLFPSDFGVKAARGGTAVISLYCDMSSFFYYKNLLMGANRVMLQELSDIKIVRSTSLGLTEQEALQYVQAMPYEENNPYNPAFAYNIFLLSVIFFVMIQQTMFYGMSLVGGTLYERKKSFYELPGTGRGRGALRYVFGRGLVYVLIYALLGLYISMIVPAIFGIVPQRGEFWHVEALTMLFVVDCAAFSMVWSSLSLRRESVFLLFLFMSPICVFLTGTSWPAFAMPKFWKLFSYAFPTTFGCQAYININTAGTGFNGAADQIIAMLLQTMAYMAIACAAAWFTSRKRARITISQE